MSLHAPRQTTMRSVEYWFWWIRDERTGQAMRTRWRMTEEQARQYDPRARRLPGSRQIRLLDDPEATDAPTAPSAKAA